MMKNIEAHFPSNPQDQNQPNIPGLVDPYNGQPLDAPNANENIAANFTDYYNSVPELLLRFIDPGNTQIINPVVAQKLIKDLTSSLNNLPQPIIINGNNAQIVVPYTQPHQPNIDSQPLPIKDSGKVKIEGTNQIIPTGNIIQNKMILLPGSKVKKKQNNRAYWTDTEGKLAYTFNSIQNKPFDYIVYHIWRKHNGFPPLKISEKVPSSHLQSLHANDQGLERFSGDWVGQYKKQPRYSLNNEVNAIFGFDLIELRDDAIVLSPIIDYEVHTSPPFYPEIKVNSD